VEESRRFVPACGVVCAVIGLLLDVGTACGQPAPLLSAPDVVRAQLPGWRLARKDDVSRMLADQARGGRAEHLGDVLFPADFDGDGRQDAAVLVVNEKLQAYRAYFVLNTKAGVRLEQLFEQKWTKRPSDGVIRNPMFFKPAGAAGISGRVYNTLVYGGTEQKARLQADVRNVAQYTKVPAVEIWTGQKGYDEDYGDVGDMAYCSATWYYDAGVLRTFRACD